MKTDDFDKAIRKKIESLNTENYTNAQLDKVHNYVRNKQNAPNTKRKFMYYVASFIVAAIVSLLTWNVVQLKQNASLKNAIDTLKQNLKIQYAKNTITKTDTVFITKYVALKQQNNQPVATSNTTIDKQKNNKTFEYKQTNNNALTSNKKSNNSNTIDSEIGKTKTPPNRTNATLVANSSNIPNTGVVIEKEGIKTEEAQAIENSKSNSNLTTENKTTNSQKEITKNAVSTQNITSQTDTSNIDPQNITPVDGANIKHPFRLRNLTYQLGLSVSGAKNQKSIAAIGVVQFNKSWSLVTGIKSMVIDNEKFGNENDFNHRRDRKFRNQFASLQNDSAILSNIDIKYKIYQIPLAVNYMLALRNSFAINFSLGTDLDISANQLVNYHRENNIPTPGLEADKKLSVNTPILVFNNAVITAGLAKSWKNFSFQLSPYISPQITRVSYKKESIYYGANFRILYSI